METYITELVTSLLGNRHTTPLLDKLGKEVDTGRFALHAAVEGLLLRLTGLMVVDADSASGLRGRGGGDGELGSDDWGDVDVNADVVGCNGGWGRRGHVSLAVSG